MKLEFVELNIEASHDALQCTYDYVMIYDGPGPRDKLIGKYCGIRRGYVRRSSSNKVYVVFVTDRSVGKQDTTRRFEYPGNAYAYEGSGFRLAWYQVGKYLVSLVYT